MAERIDTYMPVFGQERPMRILSSSRERNRLAHAYLFYGPAGIGKDAVAMGLARGLNCEQKEPWGCGSCGSCRKINNLEHPAFRLVLPVPSRPKGIKEEKYREILWDRTIQRIRNPYKRVNYTPEISSIPGIGIDQIRDLKKEVILKIPAGTTRVFLISQAERMNLPAANSLLKLLEEPPARTILILTSANADGLLPTIQSRCQVLRFDPLPDSVVESVLQSFLKVPAAQSRLYARMGGGSLGDALNIMDEHFEEQDAAAMTFLFQSVSGDAGERMAAADFLLNGFEKMDVYHILQALEIWLRDIVFLRQGRIESIIHQDHIQAITSFNEKALSFHVERAVELTARAIDLIDKNVYLSLIIFDLNENLFTCL